MSEEILYEHSQIWQRKGVLRELYAHWYGEMVSYLISGRTLELGGGSGNLKEYHQNVICTDIVKVPWLNAVVDSQCMPFRSETISNLVLFDVLHHIEHISLFFKEAIRVLKPSGRIILMEPYVSLGSWFVYRYLHPEPVNFRVDPLAFHQPQPDRKPFDANQAVATIVFERSFDRFCRLFPQLKMIVHRKLSFLAYPLSGGFDHPSLIPMFLVRPLLAFEHRLSFLARFLAFRVLIVLEKQNQSS